jgi:hypothetical protein
VRVPLIHDHPQSPPGGYPFTDPSGVSFQKDNLRLLLSAIRDFRATNGLPPGNPEAEVEAAYKTLYPWLITRVGTTPIANEDPVARWVGRQWRLPPKEKDFAESETVRTRLETCTACPHYTPEHSYDAGTARRLTILSVARMQDFSACRAHAWSVGLASLIQKPETQVDAEGCWARPAREG